MDDVIKDDELEGGLDNGPEEEALDEDGLKKKKDLLDDEVESAEDIAEEEEAGDEESYDDVDNT